MSSVIPLSAAVRQNLATLRVLGATSDTLMARLASGRRAETAVDDHSAFFTSRRVDARAMAIEALSDAFNVVTARLTATTHAAEGAAKLLDQMDALLAEARRADLDPVATKTELVGIHTGLTRNTDITTLPGGFQSYYKLWVSAGGGPESYYIPSSHGTSLGAVIDTINVSNNGVTARLEGGRLYLRSDASTPIMIRGVDIGRKIGFGGQGLFFGGDPNATKVILGASGVSDGDAIPNQYNGRTITWRDADGGSFSFRYGASHDGTTVGDFRAKMAAANAAGNYAYVMDYAPGGRVRLTSTEPSTGIRIPGRARYDLGLSSGGRPTSPTTVTAAENDFHKRYRALSDQLDDLVRDSGMAGDTYAMGDSLSVRLNEKDARYTTRIGRIDRAGLGLNGLTANDWSTAEGLDRIDEHFGVARRRLEAFTGRASRIEAFVQTRASFNADLVDVLRAGSDKLTLSDPNEDGAALLANRTARTVAMEALAFTTGQERTLLQWFR